MGCCASHCLSNPLATAASSALAFRFLSLLHFHVNSSYMFPECRKHLFSLHLFPERSQTAVCTARRFPPLYSAAFFSFLSALSTHFPCENKGIFPTRAHDYQPTSWLQTLTSDMSLANSTHLPPLGDVKDMRHALQRWRTRTSLVNRCVCLIFFILVNKLSFSQPPSPR